MGGLCFRKVLPGFVTFIILQPCCLGGYKAYRYTKLVYDVKVQNLSDVKQMKIIIDFQIPLV